MNAASLSILLVADADPVHLEGGAERVLQEEALELVAQGHRVTVLARRADARLAPDEEYQGVHVVRYDARTGKSAMALAAVLRSARAALMDLLAKESYDVANIMQPIGGAAVLPILKQRGIRSVYTFLSPWSLEYVARQTSPRQDPLSRVWRQINVGLRRRMEGDVVRGCQAITALSEFSVTQLRDIHGINPESVTVIPAGVDVSRFRPVEDRAAVRDRLGLPPTPVLLTVRNLEPRMGIDMLLDAFPRVLASRPETTLLIGGSGPLRPVLEEQVERLNLGGRVRFLGYISEEELPLYYAAADVFVIPTRSLEGFGLVTVEALACGTPVIGTPIGSTPEILRCLDARLVAREASAESLAESLVGWLGQEQPGGGDLSQRCRQLVETTYTWRASVGRLVELYRRAAGVVAAAV